MRHPIRFVFVCAVAVLATACSRQGASPDQAAVDAAVGAYKTCAGCHGATGEGNAALNAPALVNLDGWYLRRQVENFARGVRGGHPEDVHGQVMAAQMAALADSVDVDALVAQVAEFPNLAPQITISADIASGRDRYNMVCGACHGPDGIGNEKLNSPGLRGIDDWYLLRQYENFRSGVRGSHGDDLYGQQMQRMGQVLQTREQVEDVVAYLASLGIDD